MKKLSFKNTIGLAGEPLFKAENNAKTQDYAVLELFKSHPDAQFTPWDARSILEWEKVPITSLRRAISNLTKLGLLEKTHYKKMGPYNQKSYCWRLRPRELKQMEIAI